MPPALSSFLKTALAVWDLHGSIHILGGFFFFSISVKNAIGILMGIALNL